MGIFIFSILLNYSKISPIQFHVVSISMQMLTIDCVYTEFNLFVRVITFKLISNWVPAHWGFSIQ